MLPKMAVPRSSQRRSGFVPKPTKMNTEKSELTAVTAAREQAPRLLAECRLHNARVHETSLRLRLDCQNHRPSKISMQRKPRSQPVYLSHTDGLL